LPSLPGLGARAVRALSFALGVSACGDPGTDPSASFATAAHPIIGGSPAEDPEFKAVVSLGGCSGTLVHPSLVVYAAHCGTSISTVRFGAHATSPDSVVDVDRCSTFPAAKLGDGSDLAFCVLADPVLDVEPERILTGCELDELTVGKRVTIVGFGVDRDGGDYGEKRYATSRIDTVGDELILRSGGADTCRGDSGGPVFMNRIEPDGTLQRRLVGVTSAGSESECGQGVGHYVNVATKLDWLEDASQLDLSPCFSAASWAPTPACTATAPPASAGEEAASQDDTEVSARTRLASCGGAFDAPPDEVPPVVAWTSPSPPGAQYALPAGATFTELELAVEATDVGWGIERVSFTLFDEQEQVLFERVDEVAPYGLPTFRLPPGRFTVHADAFDFAGNSANARVTARVGADRTIIVTPGRGCGFSPRGAERGNWLAAMLALLTVRTRRVARPART
jgi:hypothetical protein